MYRNQKAKYCVYQWLVMDIHYSTIDSQNSYTDIQKIKVNASNLISIFDVNYEYP